jgi:hypothetical protein
MKYIILLLTLIATSGALTACASMDTTGGFYRGGTTMTGNDIYEPNFGF